jgi:hypothetical protein
MSRFLRPSTQRSASLSLLHRARTKLTHLFHQLTPLALLEASLLDTLAGSLPLTFPPRHVPPSSRSSFNDERNEWRQIIRKESLRFTHTLTLTEQEFLTGTSSCSCETEEQSHHPIPVVLTQRLSRSTTADDD